MSFRDNSFPMTKGNVNLTSGSLGGGIYLCVADGSLKIVWMDTTTETVNVVEGNAYNFTTGVTSIEVLTGTFHRG